MRLFPKKCSRHQSAIIVLAVLCGPAYSADRCDAILRDGVWEFHRVGESIRQTSSFLNWFCSQEFQSYESVKNSGFSIGLDFAELPLDIGGFSRDSQWGQYSRAACSMQHGQYQYISLFSDFTSKASPVLADAWKACISAPGFHGTVTYTDDPTVFTLRFDYVGLSPSDKATLRGLAIRPKDAKCDPIVSEKKPIVVATTQEQTLLCDRPKEKAVTIVATADRKVDPSSTFNVRVVNSPDPSIYREITDAKVDGHASWISEKIVIKAGANIEIVAKDEKPSLAIAAKTIIVEGPFTVHGKGITGKSGEPQTACAPGGCQWVSGPPEDSSACHNNWMLAGGSPDDKGRPGQPGGKGGEGPIVTFRYGKLQGDSADVSCNLPGGDGGPGGAGGRGRELIDCSNPGSLRKSGPGGDPGPQGPSGESGKCSWIQSVQTTSTQASVAKAISARRQRLSR